MFKHFAPLYVLTSLLLIFSAFLLFGPNCFVCAGVCVCANMGDKRIRSDRSGVIDLLRLLLLNVEMNTWWRNIWKAPNTQCQNKNCNEEKRQYWKCSNSLFVALKNHSFFPVIRECTTLTKCFRHPKINHSFYGVFHLFNRNCVLNLNANWSSNWMNIFEHKK